jgi:hypothetical protein
MVVINSSCWNLPCRRGADTNSAPVYTIVIKEEECSLVVMISFTSLWCMGRRDCTERRD